MESAQHFTVGSGPLRGTYDSVLCLTDLETDDCLALLMLSTACAGVPFNVITGEGDQDKAKLASNLLGAYGYSNARVVRGTGSARSYPVEVLSAYDSAGGTPAPIEDTRPTDFARQVLQAASSPLVIILKPPIELVADEALEAMPLAKAACAVYGSFNFRRVMEEYPGDGEPRLQRLLSAFRSSLVIERGSAVGSDAILDNANIASAFAALKDSALGSVMAAWNAIAAGNLSASVAEDSAALVAAAAATPPDYTALEKLSMRIARRAGVCRCIGAANGQQIAAADPIVAALLLEPACMPLLATSCGSSSNGLRRSAFSVNAHSALVWQTIDDDEELKGGDVPTAG
eukprot:COSAG05_NODE_3594_length_1971_cov_17.520833_2_plen_345_part_00